MNIILILSDTFRYDNLFDRSAAMPVRTPHIDAFHQRAVSFTRFYTGSFPTVPQRTDMTSGRIGWPWHGWQPLTSSTKNHMPEILGEAGYATQLLCDCPHLFNQGFNRGFSAADVIRGQEGDVHFLRMNAPIERAMEPSLTRRQPQRFGDRNLVDIHRWEHRHWRREEDRFPPRTARRAVQWLEENYRHHPLLLWLDFFDPHEPWDPPEYMVRRYDPDYDGEPMLHPNYGKAEDYTTEQLRNLRAHYCAEAELVDRHVGRVLEKIDDLQLWDDSIVIFTTDHGISLGEHNRTGKSNLHPDDPRYWPVCPEVAHIPFLIAAPGLEGGREVGAIAQSADILPTLLDLAGVDARTPEPFQGQSLAPLLRGEPFTPAREFAVTSQHVDMGDDGKPHCPGNVTPVLYTDRWAYAPLGPEGSPELYDLEADPYAERDVLAGNIETARELQKLLMDHLADIDAPQGAVAALSHAGERIG